MRIETITSTAGCEVPEAMEEIAVSMISIPASIALRFVATAAPLVSWL